MLLLVQQVIVRAMHPLVQMAKHMDAQDYTQLHTVKTVEQPSEVQSLTDALNDLFDRLNESYAREKNFAADAAHELRNPLAALSIQVDNALEENTNQNLQPVLDNIKQVSDRLSHLVRQLLTLSKVDRNLDEADWQPLDLFGICQQVIAENYYKAEAKNQNIDLSGDEKLSNVRGVKELLTSLVSNLVDNAIRYTPNQGTVSVTCTRQGEQVILTVSDSGNGLSEEGKKRVLDRFYREAGTGQAGAGIGLSIVNHVMNLHKASLALKDAELGGLQVECCFNSGN